MIFTLDTSGQLVAWEQSVRIDIQKIDFSNIEGAPQGSRVDIQAEENVAVTISRDGLPPLASAPASSEMIELPSYSGSASGAFFPTLEAFDIRLNAALQDGKLDSFWQEFSAAKTMPLVFGDLAVFLYRGEEKSVTWPADWSNYRLFGTGRLGTSDLWMHTVRLPLDARLEYQIQLDGKQLITDPLNPIVETGGLGSKSVVQMPGYVSPEYVLPQEGVLQGTLTENNLISSKSLGYDVNYRVYTPAGYEKMRRLPVLYVTDGQDFLAFGKLEVALDNLIAGGKIRPVMAVFIDPRDTKTGENLREKQFLDNPKYGDFIASELVPQIDRSYHSDPSPDARAIVGASYGGYFVSTFVLSHSDIFHLAACLSPSFWRNPKVIENYRKIDRLPLKFFVSTGIFNDTDYHSRLFKEMLEDMGYPLRYIESNEGHSYGNWRGKFEQMLAYLIPPT